MKRNIIKVISLLICALMLVSIAGCGSEKTETTARIYIDGETEPDGDKTATKGFRVGFGRVEIMPDDSVPLRGYGDSLTRMSTGFLDEIYISCVAVTDSNNKTLLMLSVDLVAADTTHIESIRNYAKEKYDIDPEYVHLTATHNHSAPDVRYASQSRAVLKYVAKLYSRSHEVIDLAMADRKVAEVSAGETKTEHLNFDRHWLRSDGTMVGDNSGMLSEAPIVSRVSEPDETMRLIKFTRKKSDGSAAKDVLLVNWQAHDHLTGGGQVTDISADWTGAFIKAVEAEKNCYMAYYQGCAGNLNEIDRIFTDDNRTTDYEEFGKFLSEYALDIYDKLDKYETGDIKAETKEFTYAANHKYDSLITGAQAVAKLYDETKSHEIILGLCKQYNVHGIFHARAIINHAKVGETYTIPLSVYSFGDIAFTAAPVELFDTAGEDIREGSPYKFTFSNSYTDGHHGYVPSALYCNYTCYEEYSSNFDSGASEKIVEQLLDMLKDIKNS